jgi:hypothetical protein
MNFDANLVRLRFARSRMGDPVTAKADYDELFREMSPVPTDYWIRPGTAPFLQHRAAFDDVAYNDRLRSNRRIVKGRFRKNGIAYVRFEEMPLYAAIFRREIARYSPIEWKILDLLSHEGPMSIGTLKEVTGMYVKDIVPVLHDLQSAFLVFEDQRDDDWERSWFLMENEFPDVDFGRYGRADALAVALRRFVRMNVFGDAAMVRSFFGISAKEAETALASLAAGGILVPAEHCGRKGYVLSEDVGILNGPALDSPHGTFALNRNDFLVRSNEHLLKAHFPEGEWKTMYLLLVDGAFHGVVEGGFKFGPHVVENVRLDLPEDEAMSRKAEILAAVGKVLDPVESKPRRYQGIPEQ